MNSRALSLQAYQAYARKGTGFVPPATPRPDGPLIWAHSSGKARGRALSSLCMRLQAQRPEVAIIASGDTRIAPGFEQIDLPDDNASTAAGFADHWAPDIVLWASQTLCPLVLSSVKDTGAALIALDCEDRQWTSPSPRWLPDPGPATLMLFDTLYTVSTEAERRLRRLGVPGTQIRTDGPLHDAALPLDCSDSLHEEMAGTLAGRPVWLAARVRADEAGDILSAHRQAIRFAHRLLLIMVPNDGTEAGGTAQAVEQSQLRTCFWENGDMPDENSQILLTEGVEDLGLWYRLAPLAFLGGSLRTGHGGHDPFEAAALGTAILYGPNVGRHLGAYTRLVEAGAARIVSDADSLAAAVTALVAPDQAATMAHAGWDAISAGAALVDDVLAEIGERLDRKEAS